MINKMTTKLKELHSNLGLPETVLSSVAGVAIIGLADDANDDVITSRAKEDRIVSMLKSFQSHADAVRTKAVRDTEDKNKGGKQEDNVPEWAKTLMDQQNQTQQKLLERIETLEKNNVTTSFNSMVDRIGKELLLSDEMLDLCKQGLSSDMTEQAVKDKLGAFKKAMVNQGAKFEESISAATTDAQLEQQRAEALKWVKEHEVK